MAPVMPLPFGGGISLFIAVVPGLNIMNVILHWYLWFSNGTPPGSLTEQYTEEDKEKTIADLKSKGYKF